MDLSVPMDAQVSKPLILQTGRLDDRGVARIGSNPTSRPEGEAWILLVMDEEGKKVLTRSQLFFPHAGDDRTPADAKPWQPPASEKKIR